MITQEEIRNLKKYAFMKSNFLLDIKETIEGKFCIRPIRWSASYSNGKLIEGKYLASFHTKEEARNALVEICNYSMGMAIELSL